MALYDRNPQTEAPSVASAVAKSNKIVYVDGVSKSVMKKCARYEFGDTVHSVAITNDGRSFNVILTKDFPDWQKIKFAKFWKVTVLIAQA